jgi:hypothetical protein
MLMIYWRSLHAHVTHDGRGVSLVVCTVFFTFLKCVVTMYYDPVQPPSFEQNVRMGSGRTLRVPQHFVKLNTALSHTAVTLLLYNTYGQG